MKGKIAAVIIIIVIIAALVFTWYFMKNIMDKYNLDERATNEMAIINNNANESLGNK